MIIGTLDPSTYVKGPQNSDACIADRRFNRISSPATLASPKDHALMQHIRPFTRIPRSTVSTSTQQRQKKDLKEYIVRFKQGTGTDDIRAIEHVIESQGATYSRRGSLSQDLDAKLPVESLRYLSEQECVERLVKSAHKL